MIQHQQYGMWNEGKQIFPSEGKRDGSGRNAGKSLGANDTERDELHTTKRVYSSPVCPVFWDTRPPPLLSPSLPINIPVIG